LKGVCRYKDVWNGEPAGSPFFIGRRYKLHRWRDGCRVTLY